MRRSTLLGRELRRSPRPGRRRPPAPAARPGRALSSSNQRLTYLKSSSSCCCAFQFTVHGIGDHVGDRVLVAGQIAAVVKPVVEDAIEPVDLVAEAAHAHRTGRPACRRGEGSGRSSPVFGPWLAICQIDPLRDLVAAAEVRATRSWPDFLREIEQDRAGFEDADRRAAAGGLVVDERRHPVVGVHLQVSRLELVARDRCCRG